MSELNVLQDASFYVFTAFYFSFLKSTLKTAALWGAFELGRDTKKPFWKGICSLGLLIFIPIFIYCLISRITIMISVKQGSISNSITFVAIIKITFLCFMMGLFPLATKHLWCVIAKTVEKKFKSTAGWFNSSIILKELPKDFYSFQVIVLVIMAFSLVIYYFGMPGLSSFKVNLLLKVYTMLYIAQFTVLYYTAKKRNYFYDSPTPKWIISRRMFITIPGTVIIPAGFGMAIWPLLRSSSAINSSILLFFLILAIPFPYWMNQSILLLAKKRIWASQNDCPEIAEGGDPWWKFCFLISLICIAMLVYFIASGQIDYTLKLDAI